MEITYGPGLSFGLEGPASGRAAEITPCLTLLSRAAQGFPAKSLDQIRFSSIIYLVQNYRIYGPHQPSSFFPLSIIKQTTLHSVLGHKANQD